VPADLETPGTSKKQIITNLIKWWFSHGVQAGHIWRFRGHPHTWKIMEIMQRN
jgi:hypothetical protein